MTTTEQTEHLSWIASHRAPSILLTILPFLLLGLVEMALDGYAGAIAYFVGAGIWALVVTPFVLGLPHRKKPFREFCYDIRLLPVRPLTRNILIGLLMAALTLGAILLASILTKHFVLDWSIVTPLRLVKGLTRGVWEEVFFRGIALAVLIRLYGTKKGVLWSTFIFAVVHFNAGNVTVEHIVDIVSIFFMGLLFAYITLKTGSLLPAIVFHYVHDIFVYLVQNAPGADPMRFSIYLYGLLWVALALGAFITKAIVERWPGVSRGSRATAS